MPNYNLEMRRCSTSCPALVPLLCDVLVSIAQLAVCLLQLQLRWILVPHVSEHHTSLLSSK